MRAISDVSTSILLLDLLQKKTLPLQKVVSIIGSSANVYLWMDMLRTEGVEIDIQRRDGVDEVHLIDTTTAYGSHSLSWALKEPVYHCPRCTSTNDLARVRGEKVIVSDEQSAGRGRRGRTWLSDTGKNLLCSIVVKPDVPVSSYARCSLIWASLLAQKLDLWLKWPNDLLSKEGKKVGGLLCEYVDEQKGIILGVGINIEQSDFSAIPQATSLEALGSSLSRAEVLALVHSVVRQGDVKENLDRWRSRALFLGKTIRVNAMATKVGVMTGIREDGALLLDGEPIYTGDVYAVEKIK